MTCSSEAHTWMEGGSRSSRNSATVSRWFPPKASSAADSGYGLNAQHCKSPSLVCRGARSTVWAGASLTLAMAYVCIRGSTSEETNGEVFLRAKTKKNGPCCELLSLRVCVSLSLPHFPLPLRRSSSFVRAVVTSCSVESKAGGKETQRRLSSLSMGFRM